MPDNKKISVAPFTGAWIETAGIAAVHHSSLVAPFTGAWIETASETLEGASLMSLPSRERGLKLGRVPANAPADCRSLHGSVD